MKRKELLELRMIGLTDEIRDKAIADRGRDLEGWGTEYKEFDVKNFMRAEVEDGFLKLEIYPGADIRKGEEEPKYRVFLSAEENRYVTYLPREGKWSKARIKNLPDLEWNWRHTYKTRYWMIETEEKMMRKYLKAKGKKNAGDVVENWQTQIMHQKEVEEIDRVMNQVKESPADFGRWIKEEAFWRQQYLFYDAKRQKAYCTACGQMIRTDIRSAHNKTVTCPACGREVQGKSWRKQKEIGDTIEAALIQRIPEGIIVRKFICMKRHSLKEEWREKLYIWERVRYLFAAGLIPKKSYEFTCFKGYGPQRWCNATNGYIGSAVIYPGTIGEIRKGTALKDIPLEILLEQEKGRWVWIERTLHAGEITGHLIRAGLTKLAWEDIQNDIKIIDKKAKTAEEALRINGDRINRLRQCNGGKVALGWLQYEEETSKKVSQETLVRLEKEYLDVKTMRQFLDYGITPARAMNYLEKQKGDRNNILIEWSDYLHMAERNGRDVTDDIVRYPKELKKRHNELVDLENQRKDEEKQKKYKRLDRQIQSHIQEAARYYWQDKEYMIVPAAKCIELVREGRILHHCVGAGTTYMERMAAGRSWILFLRRKEDLADPWYTIEIDMETDKILQWYSEYDRKPEQEKVRRILNKFLKSVKRERERLSAGAASVLMPATA